MCGSTDLSLGLTRVPVRGEDGKSPEMVEESGSRRQTGARGRAVSRLQSPERNHNGAVTKEINANFLLQNQSMNGKMMINKCYLTGECLPVML